MAYSVLVFFVLISTNPNATEHPPTTTNTYPTPTAEPTPTTTTTTYPNPTTTNSTLTATTVYSNYTVINFPANADHAANADHPANACLEAPTGNISSEKWENDSVKWFLELIVPVLTLIAFSLGIWRWCSSRGKKASHQNVDFRNETIEGGGGGGDAEENGGGGGDEPNLLEIAEVLQGLRIK